MSLSHYILGKHLVKGTLSPGEEITIKVDQTLTQDTTGTMAYLQLEAISPAKIAVDTAVAYIDHNTLQTGFENADDHMFIQSICKKYGITYSKAGNGICHQLQLENYAVPGAVLIGSDSHTPTGGGIGSISIGVGGLDIARALSTGNYTLKVPKVYGIEVTGELKSYVSGKDVILYVLQQLTVKGGVGYIMEYFGDGIKNLDIEDRATITNMGAELGATTSLFPWDSVTKDFLKKHQREDVYYDMPEFEASYDEILKVNLDELEPLIAIPNSPDNVVTVASVAGTPISQIAIGSCTNSSYRDLSKAISLLKKYDTSDKTDVVLAPGSKRVLKMLADSGDISLALDKNVRLLESACGPCIGMGQAPTTGAHSLRTFNRNFKGRCGTQDSFVYLSSPETAMASAIDGVITSPSKYKDDFAFDLPDVYPVHQGGFTSYKADPEAELVVGPNIATLPTFEDFSVLSPFSVDLIVGDNITTDDIVPSGAKLLPLRSNINELSKYCFINISKDFYKDVTSSPKSCIIGGDNYGQGSSREHAALLPRFLGVNVVVAKSFARIHKSNLVNFGILPLTFIDLGDYDDISLKDQLMIEIVGDYLTDETITLKNITKDKSYKVSIDLSEREREMILDGGLLNFIRRGYDA